MAGSLSPGLTQGKNRSLVVHCGLALFIGMPSIHVQTLRAGFSAGSAAALQGDQQAQKLEQEKPIERELAGGQSHSYQLTLDAGQYANLVVDQRGINVVVQLSGPDGKRIMEFDSESRPQGKESVSLVAEAAGSYRLIVRPKQKEAPEGSYEIRIEILRAATDDDRDLWQARKLVAEGIGLYGAGKYDEARPLYEHAIEIRERALGANHLEVAQVLNNLATVYHAKGEYAKAGPLFRRALDIKEKALGPEHPDVAGALNNLAIFYIHSSDYSKAESLFERALALKVKALGPDHPDVAMASNNLALVYHERGDDLKAEPLFRRALSIWEKALGPEHPRVSYALLNLAKLYQDKGDYAEAEPLLRRALAIDEKALGPDHPDVAFTLNNLAALHYDKGEYAKAELLSQRALILREKALGPESLDVAQSLCSLARVCRARGDYAKSESLFLRALRIRENALGPEHPDVAWSLNYLAWLYAGKGDIAEAITFLSRANVVRERNLTLTLNLDAGSERQKLAYLALFSEETDFTLSLHSQIAPDNPQALNLAFTTLLRRKGRGLDAMTDTIATLRRHSRPQDQGVFDQLTEARSQLAARILKESGAASPDSYENLFKPLEEKVERLEAELSVRSDKFRAQTQPVTLAAVQAALPADGALIEFAVYTPREPQTEKSKPPRYIAYALAAQGRPKWADLGEAAAIDHAVGAWRKALRNPNRMDVKRLARTVDDKVMRPLRPLLGKTRRLLIAPDGSLNLIPFAALVDEHNRYLIERHTISYLTSGRDLLRLQIHQPSENAPLLVANPAFGRASTVVAQQKSADLQPDDQARTQGDPAQIYFQPLPSTGREALAIKVVLPEASLLLREQATESAVKHAKSPRVLHIATHGFFFSDQEAPPAETRGGFGDDPLRASDPRFSKWAARIENPLLRSGLALTGANQGKSGDEDGLLTALEVAGLDLWGTKLAVLSACDTGVGDVRNGEGVQGLRRALVLAGSESQVMSLWPALDSTTSDLMVPYYKALRQGEGRSDGLRRAQLQMLRSKESQHPFYWAAFIQSGEWANLDGQR